MSVEARTVLVVEDNSDHALLVQLAAERVDPSLDVHVAPDGREAVAYLSGEPPYDDRSTHPFPSLVMLDLIMPRLDGFGVLDWIGHQSGLRDLPVVVLTSSVNPGDESRAAAGGARAFHTKPADMEQLGATVRAIVERWLV